MHLLDKVKISGDRYDGKEGTLISINNNMAYVVLRYEVGDKLYGYIRVAVNINDIEPIL